MSWTIRTPDVLAILGALLILIFLNYHRRVRSRTLYPPGPPSLPLIGNVLDFPKDKAYVRYKEWSEQYESDIIHLEAFGKHVYVLNSQKVMHELLEKKSNIYASRPFHAVLNLVDWTSWSMAFMPFTESWKLQRKIGQRYFRPGIAMAYQSIITDRAQAMLRGMLQSPHDFKKHFRMQSTSATMEIIYGYHITSLDDPSIHLTEEAVRTAGETSTYPGSDLLNTWSVTEKIGPWVPGWAGSIKHAAKMALEFRSYGFEFAKENWVNGTGKSMIADLLTEYEKFPGRDIAVRDLVATLLVGGADTTPSTNIQFIHFMALNPSIQARAQEELDALTDHGERLPTLEDRPNLPYIEAVMREVFRLGTILPTVLNHSPVVDDIYETNGKTWIIPKGSAIIPNIWAVNRDKARYGPNPEQFDPFHHLTPEGKLRKEAGVPITAEMIVFGFGRRKCAGRYFADLTIWLTIALLLSSFDITFHPEDKEDWLSGKRKLKHHEGIVYQPHSFRCIITPRSDKAKKLVSSTAIN